MENFLAHPAVGGNVLTQAGILSCNPNPQHPPKLDVVTEVQEIEEAAAIGSFVSPTAPGEHTWHSCMCVI